MSDIDYTQHCPVCSALDKHDTFQFGECHNCALQTGCAEDFRALQDLRQEEWRLLESQLRIRNLKGEGIGMPADKFRAACLRAKEQAK